MVGLMRHSGGPGKKGPGVPLLSFEPVSRLCPWAPRKKVANSPDTHPIHPARRPRPPLSSIVVEVDGGYCVCRCVLSRDGVSDRRQSKACRPSHLAPRQRGPALAAPTHSGPSTLPFEFQLRVPVDRRGPTTSPPSIVPVSPVLPLFAALGTSASSLGRPRRHPSTRRPSASRKFFRARRCYKISTNAGSAAWHIAHAEQSHEGP
ncbi:hypothetical protein C8Q79DRAFT_773968 [Trametes meyenii]|nr:hypothetical protein C8Q79DRAFT_773968 [Trametes meyenii]